MKINLKSNLLIFATKYLNDAIQRLKLRLLLKPPLLYPLHGRENIYINRINFLFFYALKWCAFHQTKLRCYEPG